MIYQPERLETIDQHVAPSINHGVFVTVKDLRKESKTLVPQCGGKQECFRAGRHYPQPCLLHITSMMVHHP